jgi:hypothetical protein
MRTSEFAVMAIFIGTRRHTNLSPLLFSATVTLLTACVASSGVQEHGVNLLAAENLIEAFYSFDRKRLTQALESAKESQPEILFYQGWAAGGNYRVVKRMPCVRDGSSANCSITVKDDLMGALGIAFDVTDTFHVSFTDGRIVAVKTSSNDLPVFDQAMKWVRRERPELVRVPCEGFFSGGPTPGDCVKGMVKGFADFAASKDFPPPPYGHER